MNHRLRESLRALLLLVLLSSSSALQAQLQTTGTPGSADATTTISGKQLPAPQPPGKGKTGPTVADSKTWWPPRVVPKKGAPNVLLIMTDDAGFGVSGTFGGVIPTPALDRVANNGLRYTQFNSTSLCSPTRAALLTGRNHHSVGFGVITELSTGYPGYDSIIGVDNGTIGQILKGNGYATSWFGKNHNTPSFAYSVAGPFDQWPSGMGFDYFYGFQGGETDQYTPYLFQDHTQIFPWRGKPDYNLSTDLADEAIARMKALQAANSDQPFFIYYAPGGTHSPHQPPKKWIEKFKGKFDMGWNKMREQIFANQKRLGLIPANTQLTPWPDDLPEWESLSSDEKKLFARQAEVFAAFAAYTDDEIGRVIQQVEDMGELDDTLIFYICGDNGTSPEGTLLGTPNQYASFNGILDIPVADQLKLYDVWGSRETYPHMAVGWAWAFDTPFKYTKQVASHFGGTRQGMAISWPGHIDDIGGIRTQFHHMIDIMPTIMEAAGVNQPEEINGIAQKPIQGTSMAYTFKKENAKTPSARKVQYFEMIANRGIYSEGWYANTVPPHGPWILNAAFPPIEDYKWELYNLNDDFSQNHDLAAENPEKLKEMQALFDQEAKKNNVYPLDNRQFARSMEPRPSMTVGKTEFTYQGVNPGMSDSNTANILGRSYTITAEVTVPDDGGNGMIVTAGGRFGGWGFYILKGVPVFGYNMLGLAQYRWAAKEPLTAGKHTLVYDYVYDGPGIAKGGTGTLKVDGVAVDSHEQPNSIAFIQVMDETFDVGVDTRTEINAKDYILPFDFTGSIDQLHIKLGTTQFTPAEQKQIKDAHDRVND
ncbi:Arylsulfatase [Rosistilla carotiformis]|uniref:Arylsulfatase n=1 Tax=Rosistilla carotiformis TaxID=2528017 RepID=A0A518JUQ6_9BACT|nr:arylsulfatase [Rosistilla carotiformis]QDV69272.1 Arylsulfatase [Rosistilla carotiformis]